jgi:CDP-glycerol glycerophosphotransferase (TagB/SpsB family)
VLVTDYSSMAFNAAYIERPVVYFQFDRDRVLSGAHLGRRGYFDYQLHGYGPVADTLDEAVRAVVETVDHGPAPAPEYLDRINAAFPERDGNCTQRTFQAIARTTKRVPRRRVTEDDQTVDRSRPSQ